MKFFTIQNSKVIDNIQNEDYYPDFRYSRYLVNNNNNDLHTVYDDLLKCFNTKNRAEFKGLTYAFAGVFPETSLKDINQFVELINNNTETVGTFISELKGEEENYSVAEIEYDENEFDPLFIDYNDWQLLMLYSNMRSAECEYIQIKERIFQSMLDDTYSPEILRSIIPLIPSTMPPSIYQAHVPYIKKSNLTNTYPFSCITSKLNWEALLHS